MRTCDEKWSDALMDAALGVKNPEVERHVRDCADCAAALSRLRADASALDEAVGVLSSAEPSPWFRARVLAQVSDTPVASRWHWAWLGAASAVVASIAFVLATTTPSIEPEPVPDLADWRSPTAGLLYSTSYERLQRLPRLGGFPVDLHGTLFEENNDEKDDES